MNAIVAFGWIAFALLSIIMTTLLMHYAALGFAPAPAHGLAATSGATTGPAYGMSAREKPAAEAPVAGPVPVTAAAPTAASPAAPVTV